MKVKKVLCFVLLCLCIATIHAQGKGKSYAIIRFAITDEFDAPIPFCRISVNEISAISSEKGIACLSLLPPSSENYTYIASATSFPKKQGTFYIHENQDTIHIRVRMIRSYRLKVRVVDSRTRLPVPYAGIFFNKKEVLSDEKGEATLFPVPSLDAFHLRIRARGYILFDRKVAVKRENNKLFHTMALLSNADYKRLSEAMQIRKNEYLKIPYPDGYEGTKADIQIIDPQAINGQAGLLYKKKEYQGDWMPNCKGDFLLVIYYHKLDVKVSKFLSIMD